MINILYILKDTRRVVQTNVGQFIADYIINQLTMINVVLNKNKREDVSIFDTILLPNQFDKLLFWGVMLNFYMTDREIYLK